MIPSRRLMGLTGLLLALALLLPWWPDLALSWAGVAAGLVVLAGLDAWAGRQLAPLRIERQTAGVWAVNNWHDVELVLHNDSGRDLPLLVQDDHPGAWQQQGLPHRTTLRSGQFCAIRYRLQPPQRGDGLFGPLWLRVASPLGLWWRQQRQGPQQVVKVFPDYSQLLGQTVRATDRREPAPGVLRRRRRGEGTDFRQLRDYREGDSLRTIDWKATARQLKPISREYQEERDQQVVFLLDTGRRMLAVDDGASHFDHALQAVLTLSFVAQKQGDAVGLLTFGGYERWLSPLKGRAGLDRLLAGVYDIQPQEVAPDYLQAAQSLLRRLHKRAFIVLISNVRDEDDMALSTAVRLLSSKHLVMCASLRETALDDTLAAPVHNFNQALRLASTQLYWRQRQQAIRQLHLRASHLIDIVPRQLCSALVNRYLDIKESGQL